MTHSPSRCLDTIFADTAVARYAIVEVSVVEPEADNLHTRWIAAGHHADMTYLERYADVRRDPALLLPGARSIICCAVPYPSPLTLPPRPSEIASYALGSDYHDIVRAELEKAADRLRNEFGGETRVCVDTAPLRERYWAACAGLGFIGLNNHLIVPGLGSFLFLGEILSTVPIPATSALDVIDCGHCGACVRSCPTGALHPDGSLDARLCLSYLTIEHRGDFPPGTNLYGHLYGCDECGKACPHNQTAIHRPDIHPALQPRPTLLNLSAEQVAEMTQQEFSTIFSRSAVKRAKLAGLRRNALSLLAASTMKSETTNMGDSQ